MELEKWMLEDWTDEEISQKTGIKQTTIRTWRADMVMWASRKMGAENPKVKTRYAQRDGYGVTERIGKRLFSNEADLQKSFVKSLTCNFEEYVHCSSGIVDVLTDNAIYELKDILTRSRVQGAIGQLFLYGIAFPKREKIIVCNTLKISKQLEDAILENGIKIIVF